MILQIFIPLARITLRLDFICENKTVVQNLKPILEKFIPCCVDKKIKIKPLEIRYHFVGEIKGPSKNKNVIYRKLNFPLKGEILVVIESHSRNGVYYFNKFAKIRPISSNKIKAWIREGNDALVVSYFLFMCNLNYLMQNQGLFLIHASCVSINSKEALIFVGKSGSGKTTLANLFCKRFGSHFIGDDVVYCDGKFVYPALGIDRLSLTEKGKWKGWKIKVVAFPQVAVKRRSKVEEVDYKYGIKKVLENCLFDSLFLNFPTKGIEKMVKFFSLCKVKFLKIYLGKGDISYEVYHKVKTSD